MILARPDDGRRGGASSAGSWSRIAFSRRCAPTQAPAELVGKQPPAAAVEVKGIRLTAAAVERQHELATEAFAQRVLLDARLQLSHHRFVPSEAEQPLDPSLDRLEAQFPEAMDLGLGELRERELAERRAAPEGERFLERRERRLRIIVEESPSFGRELLEPAGVDAGVVDPEQVPGGPGLEWAVLSGCSRTRRRWET